MACENFPAAFALKHLLFPFAVRLNRNALRASFFTPLLSQLIEVADPPNARPWVLFKDPTPLH